MSVSVESADEPVPPAVAEAVAIADPPLLAGTEKISTGWFYGWVMLPLAMLVMACTAPGQTFGITFFNSHFRAAFDMSQTGLSATYLVATVVASLMLPYLGGLIDRFGMKRATMLAATMMALACALASQVQGAVTLFVAFVLLRTIGPGTMTLLANNTLAMWFDRRLGMASGIMQVTMAGAMAFVPMAILGLIEVFGWRGAYLALAAVFAAGLLPLVALIYRESPADVGQFPDGARTACPKRTELAETGLDVKQAMQQRSYWILLAAAATWALIGTGLLFHLEPLFQYHGLGKAASARAVGCLAIGMATMQIVGGVLADRLPVRWLLITAMGLIAVSCTVMALGSGAVLTLGFAIYGCAQGLKTIVVGTVWPRYFGRLHLGKIRGTSLTAAIAGSSLGPLIMGVSTDFWGGFTPSLWIFAVGSGLVALAACWATPPPEKMTKDKLLSTRDGMDVPLT
ncbi:MAG: MFS transporter [Pirellulales bacterium]|nr:MFS transporter [Pirellulales bacterium]